MKEALTLALEALKMNPLDTPTDVYDTKYQKAIDVAKEALAQPAQRPWVGLTDEEMREIYKRTDWDMAGGWEYERAIESKLKEKNT